MKQQLDHGWREKSREVFLNSPPNCDLRHTHSEMRHGLSRLARAKAHAKSDSAASHIFSLQACHPDVPLSFWARRGYGASLRAA
jgi:hypothetical protein